MASKESNLHVIFKILQVTDNETKGNQIEHKHSSDRNHRCLLCKEEGEWPLQHEVQGHLVNKHGEFFQERGQGFSAWQENNSGGAQRVHEKQGIVS